MQPILLLVPLTNHVEEGAKIMIIVLKSVSPFEIFCWQLHRIESSFNNLEFNKFIQLYFSILDMKVPADAVFDVR